MNMMLPNELFQSRSGQCGLPITWLAGADARFGRNSEVDSPAVLWLPNNGRCSSEAGMRTHSLLLRLADLDSDEEVVSLRQAALPHPELVLPSRAF